MVTVEEHSVIGGLGSAVCDCLSAKAPTQVLKIGVNDTFGESGPATELIKKYGLDGDGIYAKIKEFWHKWNREAIEVTFCENSIIAYYKRGSQDCGCLFSLAKI